MTLKTGGTIGKLFISYRREDSAGLAGRIYDRLQSHFGGDLVFMDVDSIPFGVDFRRHLSEAVGKCDVLLAIIGERWLTIEDSGKRRLDDPNDFVRVEIETALARGIPVIPVLIGRTPMPRKDELPRKLRALAYRNAALVDSGRDFHPHVDRIIREVEDLWQVPKAQDLSADGDPVNRISRTSPPVRETNPAPFLGYLDREMTNMRGLLVCSLLLPLVVVGIIWLAFDNMWVVSSPHMVAGAAAAVAAAALFYSQLSHLAWYYGQIQLTQSRRDGTPEELEDWLSAADGWDTWVRYRTGLWTLTASMACYAYGIAAVSSGLLRTVPVVWSLYAPLGLMLGVAALQWYLLTKFSQADEPVKEWVGGLTARKRIVAILILLSIIGSPIVGYFVCRETSPTPEQLERVQTLKNEARDQMLEDRQAAKHLLEKAQSINPRDPEILRMLDDLAKTGGSQ